MILKVVNSRTGEELLIEHDWADPCPGVGDVMELHCGETERWVVQEVDWVFEHVDPSVHEEVPLKCAMIMVVPERATREGAPDAFHDPADSRDPVCVCGHRQSVHTPTMCRGDASTCTCRGFSHALNRSVV